MHNSHRTIAFVGAGNLAGAIITGLVQEGYPAAAIQASAPTRKNLDRLESELHIPTSSSNIEAVTQADIVVLGVKPQLLKAVCEEIGEHISHQTPIISLAAGVTCASIETWLGQPRAIVRCMSNTPAQVMTGATGLFANARVRDEDKSFAEAMMKAVGITCWVEEESLIDTVTAVAGSGPAYFFLFLEAMVDAATKQGMDKSAATDLAIQTALGAAKLAQNSKDDVVELRKKVTSPNGTTERAIASFESNNIRQTIEDALNACTERARELAKNN